MSLPTSISRLSQRADFLRDQLIEWAHQNSGSENIAGLAAMETLLTKAFASIGPVECIALNGTAAHALRVRFNPAAPHQILFSGHYDTVYGREHAFQHCSLIDPETVRGPGVVDMKGGLVVMLAALEAFLQTEVAPQIGGEVLLSPDEETGSAFSCSLIEAAASRHEFGLVFEPARENGDLVRARMGTGIFTALCRGRAAHAGRDPTQGRNAIVALAEYLPKVDALNREFPNVLINIGRISGGGAVNIVPDLATADINIRIARAADADGVLTRLRELAEPIDRREGYALTIEGSFNRLPKEITARDEKIFNAWKSTAAQLNINLNWQDVGGGSDGNLLAAAGLATLDGLGPQGGHLHSPNEYVHLPSLVSRSQIAALFLYRYAKGEFKFNL